MNSRMRLWARMAIVANIVFTLAWIVAATWQGPHYSTTAHTISDMYADGAPGAWFLIVVFSLAGAIAIMFALRSVWPALRAAGRPAKIGAVLLALSIYGLGDLLSPFEREGCRLADPGCTTADQLGTAGGFTDAALSNLGVLSLVVSGFFLAAAMKRLPDWSSWAWPTRLVTIALIVVGLLDGALAGADLGGFCERLIALTGAAGITALAVGVLRRTPRHAETASINPMTGTAHTDATA
jgi:DNA-binding transcriptional regulator of glucitol operon